VSVRDFLQSQSREKLQQIYHFDPDSYHDDKVLPRLLFGEFLATQFKLVIENARNRGYEIDVRLETLAVDVAVEDSGVLISLAGECAHFIALRDSLTREQVVPSWSPIASSFAPATCGHECTKLKWLVGTTRPTHRPNW
jgi:hypothetical protein